MQTYLGQKCSVLAAILAMGLLFSGCRGIATVLYCSNRAPGCPWEGKPSADLVNTVGVPDKMMKLEDGEVWEYYRCSNSDATVNRDQNGNVSGISANSSCNRWLFRIKDGKVVSER